MELRFRGLLCILRTQESVLRSGGNTSQRKNSWRDGGLEGAVLYTWPEHARTAEACTVEGWREQLQLVVVHGRSTRPRPRLA
jgi:hypothetical protein